MTYPRVYSLDEQLEAAVTWANGRFLQATQATRLEHLRREVAEFLSDPCDEEAADVLMILAHWAHHAGVDLAVAVHNKMQRNYKRQWGQPDACGVVEHRRDATP